MPHADYVTVFKLSNFFFSGSQDIIATGGVDSTAVIFNRTSGQILSTISGHSKKVFFYYIYRYNLFF